MHLLDAESVVREEDLRFDWGERELKARGTLACGLRGLSDGGGATDAVLRRRHSLLRKGLRVQGWAPVNSRWAMGRAGPATAVA